MPEPLTVDQVAELLRTGRDAVIGAIEKGRLRAIQHGVGRQTRYEITDAALRRFLGDYTSPRPRRIAVGEIPRFYNLAEVAERSGLPLPWLKVQVRNRTIPHVRPGRTVLMTEADIVAAEAYLRGTRPADPEVQAEAERRSRGRYASRKAA